MNLKSKTNIDCTGNLALASSRSVFEALARKGMRGSTQVLLAMLLTLPLQFVDVTAGMASGHCPNQPGGNCPKPRKYKQDSAANYTAEQREKMRDKYRKLCHKKYPGSTLKDINFKFQRYTCTY